MNRIEFCYSDQPWFELSNFYSCTFTWNNTTWKSSEAAFQAAKFIGTSEEMYEKIKAAKSPKEAKELGRSKATPIREDWDNVRISIMEDICYAKFVSSARLKNLLISTGDAVLIEYSKKDTFWGSGHDYRGQNQLGKALIRVRERIKKEVE